MSLKKNYTKPGHMNVYRSPEKKTKCKCPMCGKIYIKRAFFTGRGTLREYCEDCFGIVGKRSSGVDDCNYNRQAATMEAICVNYL